MEPTKLEYSLEDGATIVRQLKKLASSERPDKAAYIFIDKDLRRNVLTRRDLWDKSRKFAAVLHRLGIRKGDVVCNTLPNSPQRLVSTFGTIVSGAVSMHGQLFLSGGADIIKNWRDTNCKAVIVDASIKCGAAPILERIKDLDLKTGDVYYKDLPNLKHVIPISMDKEHNAETWFSSLNTGEETYADNSVTQEDLAVIMATSGSTGFSKMVPHTHKTILAIGRGILKQIELHGDSVYFNNRSLGWIGGFPFEYLVCGASRVLMDNAGGTPQDIGATFISIFNREHCDTAYLMSSTVAEIIKTLKKGVKLNQRLRTCMMGGQPISAVQMEAIGQVTDSILASYGSTEMGIGVSLVVKDASLYENTCVGYPGEGIQVKVIGDDGKEVNVGETGEVYIRTPNTLSTGYLNNPEASKETFLEDCWYRTSDMGHLDAHGKLFVYCRKANAIQHQGIIHYPGWMEALIDKHQHIMKCAVVGIPDPVNHEDICLCVIKSSTKTELTSNDLREYCKDLFLTSEKDSITPIPKYYLFFEEFPANSNGKIDRKTLRSEACQCLGVHCSDN